MGASGSSRSLDLDLSRGSDLLSGLRGGTSGGGAGESSLGLSSMGTSGSPYSGIVMSSRSGGFGCSGTESDLCSQKRMIVQWPKSKLSFQRLDQGKDETYIDGSR